MAALCLASYGSFDDYKQVAADHHYEIIKASASPYIGWKLLESQDNYVFVYPGTNDWTDLLVDVMAGSVRTRFGKVHHGVNTRWEMIRPEIPSLDKPVWLAGHSLGGALAKRHAMDKSVQQVFVFNAPRIFDAKAAKKYNTPTANYVVKGDLVHRLPLFYTTAIKPLVLKARAGANKHAMQTCHDALCDLIA